MTTAIRTPYSVVRVSASRSCRSAGGSAFFGNRMLAVPTVAPATTIGVTRAAP